MSSSSPPALSILIINPNTNTSMTDSLKPVISSMNLPSSVDIHYWTCPEPGVKSINSPDGAYISEEICSPQLLGQVEWYDAFLVACYSEHPLVGTLRRYIKNLEKHHEGENGGVIRRRKYVLGIFEASVLASLSLIDDVVGWGGGGAFGIVSTGAVWQSALQEAVQNFLSGTPPSQRSSSSTQPLESGFVGCETTGLNASELHDLPADVVREKMMDATKRLLRRGSPHARDTPDQNVTSRGDSDRSTEGNPAAEANDVESSDRPSKRPKVQENTDDDARNVTSSRVQAICLGCAGMAGLDSAVRTACVEELGDTAGNAVYIVDGVKAGVGQLYALLSARF